MTSGRRRQTYYVRQGRQHVRASPAGHHVTLGRPPGDEPALEHPSRSAERPRIRLPNTRRLVARPPRLAPPRPRPVRTSSCTLFVAARRPHLDRRPSARHPWPPGAREGDVAALVGAVLSVRKMDEKCCIVGNSGVEWRHMQRSGLLGEFEFTLDAKNRVAIPARFRPAFADGIFVTRGFEHCLSAYAPEEWERFVAERPATTCRR